MPGRCRGWPAKKAEDSHRPGESARGGARACTACSTVAHARLVRPLPPPGDGIAHLDAVDCDVHEGEEATAARPGPSDADVNARHEAAAPVYDARVLGWFQGVHPRCSSVDGFVLALPRGVREAAEAARRRAPRRPDKRSAHRARGDSAVKPAVRPVVAQ